MKILHVIRRLQPSAGTSTFCVEVCNGLAEAGHDVSIALCSPEDRSNFLLDDSVKTVSVKDAVSSVPFVPDVVHMHAMWSPFLRTVRNWAVSTGIPIVWSTHGLTAPWAMRYKCWKKLPVWWLYQKRHLLSADLVHSTTELEVGWNRRLGVKNNVVIPLGTNEKKGVVKSERMGTVLFVGRLHPVKGLENLLRAWARIAPDARCGWKLRMVGPDQSGYACVLKSLTAHLGIGDSVEYPGPMFGRELSSEYDNCDCLVLPSLTENFGATVIDALAHEKPCIASTNTPWEELRVCRCGWWVSNDPDFLAAAIKDMMNAGAEIRLEMGVRGRKLVEKKYTWGAVAEQMAQAYSTLPRTARSW